jgi:hypothetical protein
VGAERHGVSDKGQQALAKLIRSFRLKKAAIKHVTSLVLESKIVYLFKSGRVVQWHHLNALFEMKN